MENDQHAVEFPDRTMLVGGDERNMTGLFFQKYWEFNHPNWRTHIFQRGGIPPTHGGFSTWNYEFMLGYRRDLDDLACLSTVMNMECSATE